MNMVTTGQTRKVFSDLLEMRTGQQLSAARSWRLETSLKPVLRERELNGIEALATTLSTGHDPNLRTRVVELLLNHESSFFRDNNVFQQLDVAALENLRSSRAATRHLSVWSAGCSTGQEVYSLAMLFADQRERWAGWSIDIFGTDVSALAIGRARGGKYSQFEIQRGLPVRTMLQWFDQQGEHWVANQSLRRAVRFSVHNLLEAVPGQFDIILCRNVLMYFSQSNRTHALGRLATALRSDGLLMLGAAETVIGQTSLLKPHQELRGFYGRADNKLGSKTLPIAG